MDLEKIVEELVEARLKKIAAELTGNTHNKENEVIHDHLKKLIIAEVDKVFEKKKEIFVEAIKDRMLESISEGKIKVDVNMNRW